mgnify:CR=1 FL=1
MYKDKHDNFEQCVKGKGYVLIEYKKEVFFV